MAGGGANANAPAPGGFGGFGGRGGGGRQWYQGIPVPTGTYTWSRRNNTNYMQTGVLCGLQLTSMFPNLILENFWHEMKHGERRRSGRKVLTQDFEQLPHAAALARNLTKPDYVTIRCGTLDNLPSAFAQLDATDRSRSLPARLRADAAAGRVEDVELVSSSLPRADRNLVRTDAMQARVMAEASSRAPRRSAGSK